MIIDEEIQAQTSQQTFIDPSQLYQFNNRNEKVVYDPKNPLMGPIYTKVECNHNG